MISLGYKHLGVVDGNGPVSHEPDVRQAHYMRRAGEDVASMEIRSNRLFHALVVERPTFEFVGAVLREQLLYGRAVASVCRGTVR